MTSSSASFVGCASHSAERQPVPRIQSPRRGCERTRSSASASVSTPSSRTSRWASDQVGKWTCESVNAGSTQRPRRSTTSGLGRAVSCVPTPPAIRSPAMASARARGSAGSIVRTTPFSRIMGGDCSVERREHDRPRRGERQRFRGREEFLFQSTRAARLLGGHGGRTSSPGLRTRPASASACSAAIRRAVLMWRSSATTTPWWTLSTRPRWPPAARRTAPPGIRAHYHENYYGAFVHDADGNNIEAVCQKPQ